MSETQVRLLGQEDPLEKEMTTHSSILDWKISWTEEPGRLQSMGSQRAGHNWVSNTYAHLQNNLYLYRFIYICIDIENRFVVATWEVG